MGLTENQNIYEGIIHSENCKSLECKYYVNLSKVDTSYKFKEIVQINIVGRKSATNYGLTIDNKLIRTSDLSMDNNIPYINIHICYYYSFRIFFK